MASVNAKFLKQLAKDEGFTKEEMKAFRQIAKETKKGIKEHNEAKRIATLRSLSKKDWTAEELKDHKKALRRIYYEKNKDKIQQQAKERRANQKMFVDALEYGKKKTKARKPLSEEAKEKRANQRMFDKYSEYGKKKRKVSAYNQFVKTNFNMVKYDNPSFSFGQISKKLGQMWANQKKK